MKEANRVKLMLDSGVFTQWNKGLPELNVEDYIRYIKDNRPLLFSYVNMDQIPGVFGMKRTTADVEASAKKSYDNLQKMKAAGLSPIAVFHQDEEFKWLERMLADGETYIGISSGKDGPGSAKRNWLRKVFSMVSDSKGKPLIRLHGFGITKGSLLLEFPWYTADSTTWSITAAFGKILVPRPDRAGNFDYSKPPVGIAVSGVVSKANNASQFEAETFFSGEGLKEKHIRKFIEEECGVTLAEARYQLLARQRCILTYYVRLMQHFKGGSFARGTPTFFHSAKTMNIAKTAKYEPLRVMFATMVRQPIWGRLMNDVGADTRLLSYFDLKDAEPRMIQEFVRDGVIQVKKRVAKPPRRSWNTEAHKNQQRFNIIRNLSSTNKGESNEAD